MTPRAAPRCLKYDFSQKILQLMVNLEGIGDVKTTLNVDAMSVTGR